jgi:hypothetical protein
MAHHVAVVLGAFADAKRAVELDRTWLKGYYHCVRALMALKRFIEVILIVFGVVFSCLTCVTGQTLFLDWTRTWGFKQ